MTVRAAVERICRLPSTFRDSSKSSYELIREAGLDRRDLTKDAVLDVISANPALVDDWLHWSEDKRTSDGWYFEVEGGIYIVGRLSSRVRLEYSDAVTACADYILKEVATIP